MLQFEKCTNYRVDDVMSWHASALSQTSDCRHLASGAGKTDLVSQPKFRRHRRNMEGETQYKNKEISSDYDNVFPLHNKVWKVPNNKEQTRNNFRIPLPSSSSSSETSFSSAHVQNKSNAEKYCERSAKYSDDEIVKILHTKQRIRRMLRSPADNQSSEIEANNLKSRKIFQRLSRKQEAGFDKSNSLFGSALPSSEKCNTEEKSLGTKPGSGSLRNYKSYDNLFCELTEENSCASSSEFHDDNINYEKKRWNFTLRPSTLRKSFEKKRSSEKQKNNQKDDFLKNDNFSSYDNYPDVSVLQSNKSDHSDVIIFLSPGLKCDQSNDSFNNALETEVSKEKNLSLLRRKSKRSSSKDKSSFRNSLPESVTLNVKNQNCVLESSGANENQCAWSPVYSPDKNVLKSIENKKLYNNSSAKLTMKCNKQPQRTRSLKKNFFSFFTKFRPTTQTKHETTSFKIYSADKDPKGSMNKILSRSSPQLSLFSVGEKMRADLSVNQF